MLRAFNRPELASNRWLVRKVGNTVKLRELPKAVDTAAPGQLCVQQVV